MISCQLRGLPEVTLAVGEDLDGHLSLSLASTVWTAWGGEEKGGKVMGWECEGGRV